MPLNFLQLIVLHNKPKIITETHLSRLVISTPHSGDCSNQAELIINQGMSTNSVRNIQ